MKTVKLIFNWLRKVSYMCKQHRHGCDNCPFRTNGYSCKIKNLVYDLCKNPSEWDVDEYERKWEE